MKSLWQKLLVICLINRTFLPFLLLYLTSLIGCRFKTQEIQSGAQLPIIDLSQVVNPTPTPLQSARPAIPPTYTSVPADPVHTPTGQFKATNPCDTSGKILMDSYPSDIAGVNLPVRIYQPPCFGEDGRVYPALYLFHGSDQTDSHWDDLGIDESAEELIRTGVIPALLIIMPGGGWIANNTSGGPLSFEQVVVDELLPYVEENYCAWSQRSGRAIGGLSRGGYWALEIAFRHSEAFSSVGGHSAALLDSAAGPDLNPQYTALSNPLGDLRIYLDIGQQDWVIGNIKQLHEDLASRSIPHVWQLNDGAHEDAYWAAHTGEYLTWYASPWPLDRNQYLPCLY